MTDKGSTDKPIKNSLLTAASTGFSLDDFSDARLLVPISLQEEIILKNSAEATAEIDLQSDDVPLDDQPVVMCPQEQEKEAENPKSIVDSTFITSLFSKSKGDSAAAAATTNPPPTLQPPVVVPPPLQQQQRSFMPSAPPMLIPQVEPVSVSTPELFPVSTIATSLQPGPGVQLNESEKEEGGNQDDSQVPVSDSLAPGIQGITLYNPSAVSETSGITGTSMLPTFYNPNAADVQETTPPSVTEALSGSLPTASSPAAQPPTSMVSTASLSSPISSTVSQGSSVNKYRLGHQRPQYAQYPGLLPTVPAANTMGNLATQPTPLPPQISSATVPPATLTTFGTGSAQPVASSPPLHPSFPQEYASTGYVFGEPPPLKTASSPNPMQYTPISYHWFFYKEVEGKGIWKPFSFLDSVALEEAYLSGSTSLVATDGGRYDVNVTQRIRIPVYWEEVVSEVRRCSWFYKGPLDNRFIPYEEEFAQNIEDEFEAAITTGVWQRRVELGGGEAIIMQNPNVIVHFCQAASPDEWGNLPENQLRPRVVKRGVDKTFMIEDGEPAQIDHLVFLVHGIGSICDFKFRNIVEAVDDFRSLSNQILHTNFSNAVEKGIVGRIEFLPVCWHKSLHGDCGVDRKLKPITLQSIPKLRHFTNDTLLDILFYTSPFYCQRIVDTVGTEINRMFNLFLQRNLSFGGEVSLGGHSLGSLILFDLLSHQPVNILRVDSKSEAPSSTAPEDENANSSEKSDPLKEETSSKMVSYTIGHAGTGQPSIVYPAFDFHPTCFFALGSPTAVFISVRGIDILGQEFKLPTCRNYFNIFHPYDPVAYRMEPLIDPNFEKPPVVIPHHKGRKRFHLEIKDAMFRVGTDIKQTMVETIKNTWKTVYSLASFGKAYESSETLEQEIDRVIEGELSKSVENQMGEQPQGDADISIGQLNGGRRVDYVLQEGPLESFNEYLFALSSHVCYWESEDTMLLIMREIYQSIGVYPDSNPASNTSLPSASPVYQPGVSAQSTSKPSNMQFMSPNQSAGSNVNPLGQQQNYPYSTGSAYQASNNPGATPPNFYDPSSFNALHQTLPTYGMQSSSGGISSNYYSKSQNPGVLSAAAAFSNPMPAGSPTGFPGRTDGYSAPVASNQTPVTSVEHYRNTSPVGPPPLSGFVPK